MAHSLSAKKRIRQSLKRRARNRARKPMHERPVHMRFDRPKQIGTGEVAGAAGRQYALDIGDQAFGIAHVLVDLVAHDDVDATCVDRQRLAVEPAI